MKLKLRPKLASLLLLTTALASCSSRSDQADDTFVQPRTIYPPRGLQATKQRLAIRLRPSSVQVAVPANELWAVNVSRISSGYPDHEPYLGKAWDWVDARFALLPNPQEHSPDNEAVFRDPNGSHIMIIRLMLPLGADGDPRKEWREARLEPDDENSAGLEIAQALHAKPIAVVAYHLSLGLEEYAPWGEFHSRFFRSGATIIRCWRRPFSPITPVCESSFNLGNGILVVVMFPYGHLDQWKNILDFARRRAAGYALATGGSSDQVLQMQNAP